MFQFNFCFIFKIYLRNVLNYVKLKNIIEIQRSWRFYNL